MNERGAYMALTNWNMKSFMKGASILTIAAIIVKVLSAVYRVPFQNLVGDKGFYIYQQVYPFIGIFIVWTSSGFAVAVSKMLAESKGPGESRGILRVSLAYLLVLSAMIFLLLRTGSSFFADLMGDSELTPVLQTGAYIVLVLPFLAVLKGVFQSEGQMIPVAISNVSEQLFRVVIVLAGTWLAVRAGTSLYKIGEITMWAAIAGETAGVFILTWFFLQRTHSPLVAVQPWKVVKDLTKISVSVSASSLILLVFQLVDSFTVYNALMQAGFTSETAMTMKGIYDRGQPLAQMGILLASTLALALVPLIAHHASKQQGRGALPFISLTFRTSILFGWAATIGLVLVLPFVNEMLFETRTGSVALIIFSVQILWLSIILPLTAIMQGSGKVRGPLLLLVFGVLIKLAVTPPLVRQYGIEGAAVSGAFAFAVVAVLLTIYFKRFWKFPLASSRFYIVLLIAAVAMAVILIPWMLVSDFWLFDALPSRWGATLTAITAVGIGAIIFLFVVLKSRIMNEREWYLLPFGKRLALVQLWLTKNRR
ncbi:MOP superfamily multidrug/oligosaccharidyl-lipid/polysaccharide flippase transporter [Sporosarcina newyorkensis 2681]|uniref:MOP superfamily multidrug/oligosaccharidyl-lipid/polysaccharide flippase transporter n=2 Tax=Sporosarcina newyorkensis TaxID=759851 RepID=F9DVB1_9BACL|nr:MOP superfamily multidrug/oligosaccharidyl-lipid/polysaccharide flippase transporter [Sporosarcina newyorkensis 2681]